MIKCFDDTLFPPKLVQYTKKSDNENIGLKFVKSLEKSARKIHAEFGSPKRILMNEKDKKILKRQRNVTLAELNLGRKRKRSRTIAISLENTEAQLVVVATLK